nr:hypothetical protein [Tanacetum cinerariifolium]
MSVAEVASRALDAEPVGSSLDVAKPQPAGPLNGRAGRLVVSKMDTLSMVSKYLNDLEEYLDDGDSMEAKNITVEKNEKEWEMFEALGHKSVVVESNKHRVVVFTKEPPCAYSKPFMRFYTHYDMDGQGYWDAAFGHGGFVQLYDGRDV